MSESEASSTQTGLEALKALETDASELERIENLLDRFNAYETIVGFDKDEVMHSNFLASLLDPKRTGVLGHQLIKEVLRETLVTARKILPASAFLGLDRVLENLDGMDLSQTLVRREHQYIDVLLTNEDHKLAVIIENKIWASEGPGQLDWYDRIIKHTHPGWDVHRIYLTPHGGAASHEAYVPFSYGALCDIVNRVVEDGDSNLDSNVWVPAQHYARMVRRRILGDPEAVRLAENLYQKYKRAFDFVYKHRPDYPAQVLPIVEGLIEQNPKLVQDLTAKDNIKFRVKEWDNAPALLTAEGWTDSGRILLFVIYNNSTSLDLHLSMGPGPEAIRQKLFDMAANHDVFVEPRPNTAKAIRARTWPIIFTRHLLKPDAYEKLSHEEREQEMRMQWDEFLEKDLPRIDDALREEAWIWESVETEQPHDETTD